MAADRVRTGAIRTLEPSLRGLENVLVAPDPTQWSAESGGVLYSSARATLQNLWLLPISPRTWKISGSPVRMSTSRASEDFANIQHGRMVYASVESRWRAGRDLALIHETDRFARQSGRCKRGTFDVHR